MLIDDCILVFLILVWSILKTKFICVPKIIMPLYFIISCAIVIIAIYDQGDSVISKGLIMD